MKLEEFVSSADPKRTLPGRWWILLFAHFLRKHQSQTAFSVSDIEACFDAGLIKRPDDVAAQIKKLLKGKKPPLISIKDGTTFSLSRDGIDEVQDYLDSIAGQVGLPESLRATVLPYLRKIAARIAEENKKRFLAEAISCLGAEAPRASAVMVWILTVDHLYDYVLKYKLAEFNAALASRAGPLSTLVISSKDDFEEIRKESDFIVLLRSAGVITNDQRKILDEKLGIRNSCAHPSGITVHHTKVINFIEDLVDNIIVKLPL